MATNAPPAGLEGVIAGETDICSVEQGQLIYRGFTIQDLAEHATFEDIAFLLIEGRRASEQEMQYFRDELVANRALPPSVIDFIRGVGPALEDGRAVPMDVLRTAVSLLAHADPQSQDSSPDADHAKAKRLLAKIPTIVGHMQNVADGRELVAWETGGDANLSHAANLLFLITGEKPTEDDARTLDISLILYAEHDYNASTFTARVITATLSDLHGAITGAIAALKGPLHGGANEAALDMLREIDQAVAGGDTVEAWMQRAFAEKRKLMGFGHRVYKHGDHRASILHERGRVIADRVGGDAKRLFDLGEQVQAIMAEQKSIFPNVDFPCGMTYYAMGIPSAVYTPIFVASRVTGWAAHVIEQRSHNRLIRPISTYTGPAVSPWNAG